MKIGIIGAGEIGTALGQELTHAGITVSLWDRNPKKNRDQQSLENVVRGADFVFLCVPSSSLRNAAEHVAPFLSRRTIVVSVAKGIEQQTRLTMDELLEQALPPKQPIVILAGPLLAEELQRGLGGFAIAASHDVRTARRAVQALRNTTIRVGVSSDFHGTAFAGALKNVYAISLGIAEGLHWGLNAQGQIAAQACLEMQQLLLLEGSKPDTLFSAPGIGDLIATALSPDSSNRAAGKELGTRGKTRRISEGVVSLKPLVERIGKRSKHLPLLNALASIIIQHKNPRRIFERLRSSL